MNKKGWIIAIIILIALIGLGIYFYVINHTNKDSSKSEYEANRTATTKENDATEESTPNNESSESEATNPEEKPQETIKQETPPVEEKKTEYKEEPLSTFSTKIYSKDSARQNNIKITCNALNGKIVKNGTTFSFCNTLGPSTTSKGYQEADIYDNNGNKKKGLRWW